MSKVAVFFKHPDPKGRPFSDPDYFRAYQELNQVFISQHSELYFVRGIASYLGSGQFTTSWQIVDSAVVETGPLQAEVIFNKGQGVFDSTVPVFNHPQLSDFCTNKWHMYRKFSQYCPVTYLVHNHFETLSAISACNTEKVVIKPVSGAEGLDIFIESKSVLLHEPPMLHYPVIIQEFLDTSLGVPGLYNGTHDLRIAIMNGTILYAEIRTPPEGSLQANVSRGGKFAIFSPKRVPYSVLSITKTVDMFMAQFGLRFYSIDYGYTAHGPMIIEMNSEVGLLPNSDGPVFTTVKQELAKTLISLATCYNT